MDPLNIFSVSVLANDSITLVYYHAMILSSSTLFELQIYFGVVIVRITKKRKRDLTKKIHGNQEPIFPPQNKHSAAQTQQSPYSTHCCFAAGSECKMLREN